MPSTNLALDFAAAREDLDVDEDVDLGDEFDLTFFRFCFAFGTLGTSVGGKSLYISVVEFCPVDSPKSVTFFK